MSRTYRGTPSPGKEWWSARPFSGMRGPQLGSGKTKWYKRALHKLERRWARDSARLEDRNDP